MCGANPMETGGYELRCRRAPSAIADRSALAGTTVTLRSEEPASFCSRVSWTCNGEARDIPQGTLHRNSSVSLEEAFRNITKTKSPSERFERD